MNDDATDEANDADSIRVGRARVRASRDAGSFYCGHMLHALVELAADAGTSIRHDAGGSPLVGFLHVPEDVETRALSPDPPRDPAERHVGTLDVVAAILRGWAPYRPKGERLKVLWTGFDAFGSCVDNPTGALVAWSESVGRALTLAFGADGAPPVEIARCVWPVDDRALGPDGVAGAVARLRPHAVLAMGVRMRRPTTSGALPPFSDLHDAEVLADDRGLEVGADGALRHTPAREHVRTHVAETPALWRAAAQS